MQPYEVFISYAHKDKALRDLLAEHLSNLRNQGVIKDWYDGDILPGSEWRAELLGRLDSAQIILLLISSSFMASEFCYSVEMTRAIERHYAHTARVLPIILRPTDWEGAPFEVLQMLPTGAKPITKWSDRDAAFKDVIKGVRKAIKELQALRGGTSPNP